MNCLFLQKAPPFHPTLFWGRTCEGETRRNIRLPDDQITSTFLRTALCKSNRPDPSISPIQIRSLSWLFLLLIVFFLRRLRGFGLSGRDLLLRLHWHVWLGYRFLVLRLLRIAVLWFAKFLI